MTLAILSWHAHRTLRNTLESYKIYGLDKMFDDRIIYFQEISQPDKDIARHYGYRHYGTKENVGIAQAYAKLVDLAQDDIFLFLENDWVMIEDRLDLISSGKHLLQTHILDVARYRHRKNPGFPLWTLQFKDNEYERPTHLLDAVHWNEPMNFPEIGTLITNEGSVYVASAKHANWTNNPTMFRTEWLKEYIVPRMGNRDVEVDLQEWWEQQEFNVGYMEPGLFTHRRIG